MISYSLSSLSTIFYNILAHPLHWQTRQDLRLLQGPALVIMQRIEFSNRYHNSIAHTQRLAQHVMNLGTVAQLAIELAHK